MVVCDAVKKIMSKYKNDAVTRSMNKYKNDAAARSMNKYKNVFQNEKYMDDVAETIIANLKKKVQMKQQMCIWGPDSTFLDLENSHDCVPTERNKILEKVLENVNVSSSPHKIRAVNEQDLVGEIQVPASYEDDRGPPKSFPTREDQNLQGAELKSDPSYEKGKTLTETITNKIPNTGSEELSDEVSHLSQNRKEFYEWCKRRKEELISRSTSNIPSSFPREQSSETCNKQSTKKRNRPKSKSPSTDTRQKQISVTPKRTQKYSKSMSQLDTSRNVMKTQVRIKITDEKNDKSHEFIVDIADISRIKRHFPKLGEILPDVDAGNKTIQYCIEAVNIILRFALFRRYNMDAKLRATTGVEILAAVKSWEINNFPQIFLEDFLQKTLPSSNISLIFSHASHYGLDAVCNACKEIAADNIALNCTTNKRKQKVCLIMISTYIEPLEFTIPFYSLDPNLELCFERHILNTVRFQALSGVFTIIGIHIQLNNDHLEKCTNLNMLEIDYSIKNISEDREIGTGRCEKPQRPINVIYFNKHLVVNPNETVEITVETDTKPYLCSVFPEEMEIRKQVKGGEFYLTLASDFKLPKSSKNLCIIGKLLYYVRDK